MLELSLNWSVLPEFMTAGFTKISQEHEGLRETTLAFRFFVVGLDLTIYRMA
jgi:hypothetical protein